MRLNADQIAGYVGGTFVVEPSGSDVLAYDVTWDSRQVKPGDLYIALPGERVDGNAFVGKAIQAGAVAALVTAEPSSETCELAQARDAALIMVPDALVAITDLARAWRSHLKGTVIALSGSSGKTTTKNLVRDVLASRYSVVATQANQNNELGVPRTLLAADPETQAVVVEMGMRGLGQIESLCEFVRPDWGIITNVGTAHIELLGSRENIARAKGELPSALPADGGIAVLNAGGEYCDFIREESRLAKRGVTCLRYDGTPQAALAGYESMDDAEGPRVWATDIVLDDQGCPEFTLHVAGYPHAADDGSEDHPVACRLALRGLHNVQNACAAAAVARAMGMSLPQISAALRLAESESGRQDVLTAKRGFTVIDDTYNANPDSMRAALHLLQSMRVPGKRIAVLGDMGELGDCAQESHKGVGEVVASLSVDRLVCVGPLSKDMAAAARAAGMDPSAVVHVMTVSEALEDLGRCVEKGDAVLVKASHSMGLERVVEGLVS